MIVRALVSLSSLVAAASIASAAVTTFPITMTGAQEVPGAGDTDGGATGTLTVDSGTNMISWNFTYTNIAAPNAMHIHAAQDGVSGGVVINLGTATSGGAGTLISQTPTSAANIAAVLANPQNFYVNIHNAAFGGGAVRGQIPKILDVVLVGCQEVPSPGDSDGSASGQVWFDTGVDKVFWNLTYSGIARPSAMHIHTGTAGVAGGVFIGLGVATSGGAGTLISEVATTDASLDAIIANPSGFYMNIHNAAFPGGAIRGQIGVPLPFVLGDLNCDGAVDAADLAVLLGAWGTSGPGDLNGDGTVDAADLALLLGSWS
ncbi:MAG: CHRD domain-containing protein [Phycisphaerae bacterium]|mgnify:CR=1 FL=1|nr:CHRD domain-containing protein [Phycisphaerae bacterium]